MGGGWMEWEGGYGGEMEVFGWVVGVCAVGEEKRKKEEVVSVIKEGCEGGGVNRAAGEEEG